MCVYVDGSVEYMCQHVCGCICGCGESDDKAIGVEARFVWMCG